MTRQVLGGSEIEEDEQRSKSSWFVVILAFWFSIVFFVDGVAAIWGAVTSTTIAEPPTLILDADSVSVLENIDPNTTTRHFVQFDSLTATGPRLVWSFATALKQFGIGGLAAILGVALYKLKFISVFSKEIFGLVHIGLIVAIGPIVGETIRTFSGGWVARAYGVTGLEYFQTDDIVSVNSVWFVWGAYIAVSFILRQGMALQAFKDETV